MYLNGNLTPLNSPSFYATLIVFFGLLLPILEAKYHARGDSLRIHKFQV